MASSSPSSYPTRKKIASVQNFPVELQQPFASDAEALLRSLKYHLPLCYALKDFDRGGRFHVRQLISYMDSKFPLSLQDRAFFARLLLDMIMEPTLHVHLQVQWFDLLIRLLRKKGMDEFLVIEWRPLYNLLIRYHFGSERNVFMQYGDRSRHASSLKYVVMNSRKYFPKTATAEIFAELRPNLYPSDVMFFRAQALLCLFLPANAPDQVHLWLDDIIHTLDLVDRSIAANSSVFQLLARTARSTIGIVNWTPYLPKLFSRFLQILDLNIEGGNPVPVTRSFPYEVQFLVAGDKSSIAESMGKIIIHTYHSPLDKNATLPAPLSSSLAKDESSLAGLLLSHFLSTVETYFHPSNSGWWSDILSLMLQSLCKQYSKRKFKETHKEVTYSKASFLKSDENFISLILPVLMQTLHSKNRGVVMGTVSSLKHAAYTFPDVVLPRLLEEVYPALTTVTESHRTLSVLGCVSVLVDPLLNRTLYPRGAEQLEALLFSVLPALDATDVFKTDQALGFYSGIFALVPFIDARQCSSQGTDLDDDARTATLAFKEWSSSFIEKLLEVIAHQDKTAKQSNFDNINIGYFSMCFRTFFSSVSEEIFQDIVKSVLRKMLSEVPPARKFYGALLSILVGARPSHALKELFPALFNRLVPGYTSAHSSVSTAAAPASALAAAISQSFTPASKIAFSLAQLSTEQLEFLLYAVSHTVSRAGAAVLPFMDRIRVLVDLCYVHEKKEVRKMGGRILRCTLRCLTEVYPAEYRPFSKKVWKEGSSQWSHWKQWGQFNELEDLDDLGVEWHFPSAAEVDAAQKLVRHALEHPLEELKEFINHFSSSSPSPSSVAPSAPTSGVTPMDVSISALEAKVSLEDASRALLQLSQISRGAHVIMGGLDGQVIEFSESSVKRDFDVETDEQDEELLGEKPANSFNGSAVPLNKHQFASFNAFSVMKYPYETSDGGSINVSLRTFLLRFSNDLLDVLFSDKFSAFSNTHSKIFKNVLRVVYSTLSIVLEKESHMWELSGTQRFLKRLLKQYRLGQTYTRRVVAVQKLHSVLQKRLWQASFSLPFTEDVQRFLRQLNRLCVHRFEDVRSKSLDVLNTLFPRFPMAMDDVFYFMINALKSPTVASESVTAATAQLNEKIVQGSIEVLFMLAQKRWLVRNWRRCSHFLKALLGSGQTHSLDLIQARLHDLFTSFCSSFVTLPLRLSAVPLDFFKYAATRYGLETVEIEHLEARNSKLTQLNERHVRHYHRLQQTLLGVLEGHVAGDIHWRYALIALALLRQFIRPDEMPPSAVLDITLRQMLSDHISLRTVSYLTLLQLLETFRHKPFRARASAKYGTPERSDFKVELHHQSVSLKEAQHIKQLLDTLHQETQPTQLAASSLSSDEERLAKWYDTQFCEIAYSGWTGDEIDTVKYKKTNVADLSHEYDLLPSSVNKLKDFCVKHVDEIIELFVQHHPTLQPTDDERGSSGWVGQGTANSIVLAVLQTLPLKWPFNRASRSSDAFAITHAKLMIHLFELGWSNNLHLLFLEKIPALIADPSKRDKMVTAAEIIAGLLSAASHFPPTQRKSIEGPIRTILTQVIGTALPDNTGDWVDALRFGTSNVDPRKLDWLFTLMIEVCLSKKYVPETRRFENSPVESFFGVSPSIQAKRLRFLQSILIEPSWRAASVCEFLLEQLTLDYVSLEYRQAREEMGRLLALLTRNLLFSQRLAQSSGSSLHYRYFFSPTLLKFITEVGVNLDRYEVLGYFTKSTASTPSAAADSKDPTVSSSVSSSASSPAASSPTPSLSSSEDATKKKSKHYLDTVLHWLGSLMVFGDMSLVQPVLPALFKTVLRAIHHTDTEFARFAQTLGEFIAWTRCSPSTISQLVDSVLLLANSPVWHDKSSVLALLKVFLPRHIFILSDLQVTKLITMTTSLLRDEQVEVRLVATRTLISVLLSLPAALFEAERLRLTKEFTRWSKKKLAAKTERKESEGASSDISAFATRHAGILGLGAFVMTRPYDVPAWLPSLLRELSSHFQDPNPIGSGVKQLFAEFQRTHKDRWEEFKEQFSEEELEALQSVVSSPSYFA